MFDRLLKPLISQSFFLFGARGTGKSTLVKRLFADVPALSIDLLDPGQEERYRQDPGLFLNEVRALSSRTQWVLIDEVQKLPKLLDMVHLLIETAETRSLRFCLTGSSARKLKMAGANLLAGRAYVNELYPLTHVELGETFDLDTALNWGTLPKIAQIDEDLSRQEFLRAYARVYLKEEIWEERLVHSLDPFRKFIEIAAQTSGHILNYANVARDCGVNDKTVKKYYEILADTFVGFYLESYHRSVRVQQIQAPKFFLFDLGIKRAMEGLLTVPVVPETFAYGRAFEHFLICECMRLNAYLRLDYRFSYLKTKDDLEIDLIIDRPGKSSVLVEIKSSKRVDDRDIRVLKQFRKDFVDAELHLWSNDPKAQFIDGIHAYPWREGMRAIGFN